MDQRILLVSLAMTVLFMSIALRAVFIHLKPPEKKNLESIANRQYQKKITLSPYRGSIFDRRGNPLAISIKKQSLFINPKIFSPSPKKRKILAKKIGVSEKRIREVQKKSSYFSWLYRKMPSSIAETALRLDIRGLYSISEPGRFYPYGRQASTLIGVSGMDNQGLMGLEASFDAKLKGMTNQTTRARDAKGHSILLDSQKALPEKAGHTITLTLDAALQEIAEQALLEGLEKADAKRGYVLVQDPHTGDILALAVYPSFDPNKLKSLSSLNSRNIALTDAIEPGSVVKPMVVAEALEQGLVSLSDQIDCEEKGIYRGTRWAIRDSHPIGMASVEDVLVDSSNIGTFKIAQKLGPMGLYQTYKKFGLTSPEQKIPFPGQTLGYIPHPRDWSTLRFANIAFGQGLMTTALEMAAVYSAFANGGKLLKPNLIQSIKSPEGQLIHQSRSQVIRTVISPKTALLVNKALIQVVERGSGRKAQLKKYLVAGKTGTSEKVDPKTKAYGKDLRIASFVGFVPASDPHLTIYVVVDEPKNKPYYGGQWAAPIFAQVARESLRFLNVAPDKGSYKHRRYTKGILARSQ